MKSLPILANPPEKIKHILKLICTCVIAICTVITTFFVLRSSIKKAAAIVCTFAKGLSLTRTTDSLKTSQYLTFHNTGDIAKTLIGLRMVIQSRLRKSFQISLDVDSVANTTGQQVPFTELTVINAPISYAVSFSAAVDSTVLSNMPAGGYDCKLYGVVDSANTTILLKEYSFDFDKTETTDFRGRCKRIRLRNHRKAVRIYPKIGVICY